MTPTADRRGGSPCVTRRQAGFCCLPVTHGAAGETRGEGMTSVWALAALWLSLALIAGLLSIWLRISTALSEIVVGTVAQLIFGAVVGSAVLGTDESWIKFLSGVGAIVLTFLAGAGARSGGVQAQMEGGGR